MKKMLIFFLLTSFGAFAQGNLDKWPAVKDFHTVIAATFHPAEEGNLEPVKARSQELFTKADALLKTDVPAEFRTKAILDAADRLRTQAERLNRYVQAKRPDAEIMKELTSLHDTFHEIVGMCTNNKEH